MLSVLTLELQVSDNILQKQVVQLFYSLAHTLKGSPGALVQSAISGLLLTLLMHGVAS